MAYLSEKVITWSNGFKAWAFGLDSLEKLFNLF